MFCFFLMLRRPPRSPLDRASAASDVYKRQPQNQRDQDVTSEQPVDLPTLARAAAQRAEHKAINEALDRFRWNRRKAATYLGVSYKTLLNKMKECGISDREQA